MQETICKHDRKTNVTSEKSHDMESANCQCLPQNLMSTQNVQFVGTQVLTFRRSPGNNMVLSEK